MDAINKKCIIRANRAGVFFGTVTRCETTPGGYWEVDLENVRRLYFWDGAATLSQMAIEGVKHPQTCKFTMVVPQMTVAGIVEIIPASEEAIQNIEAVPVWKV